MIRLAALRKIQSRTSSPVIEITTLSRGLQAVCIALIVLSAGGVAVAKKAAKDNDAAAAPAVVTGVPNLDTPGSGSSSFRLLGFRSAQFGASESEVRSAIVKDFSVPASTIHKSSNLIDRTTILSVRAPDVLADGGTAEVAYVFGYRSKKLTQVNVFWSNLTDRTLTPARLAANGEMLKAYFASQGYTHNSIVSNTPVRDGILLFRGADTDGHMTALILNGTMSGSDKAKTLTPKTLLLFYFADPKAPDVFKIPEGKF